MSVIYEHNVLNTPDCRPTTKDFGFLDWLEFSDYLKYEIHFEF